MAQDRATARKLDDCLQDFRLLGKIILDTADQGIDQSWQSLDTFMKSSDSNALQGLSIERAVDDVIMVLMTSGTTSLPKGCIHNNRSLGACIRAYASAACYDETRSVCAHLPISHIFGLNTLFSCHISGRPIVHASYFFEPGTTLQAIREERISDFAGVPAIATALLEHPDFAKTDTTCLQYVVLGATTVTPATVKSVMEDLGAARVSDAWGMTEGAPATMTSFRDCPTQPPAKVNSGYALPGAKLRVCNPDTGALCERGEAGELHMGGSVVIPGYWSQDMKKANEAFVHDEEGRWLKTGDQAIMDPDGSIEIVGRYKHLIIRGGENISPKSIEALLLGEHGLHSDVIGVPDEIAGEAPAAVIKAQPGQEIDLSHIQKTIIQKLGQGFALREIVKLDDLSLEDFPKTASGKVQKNVLRDHVVDYLDNVAKRDMEMNKVDGGKPSVTAQQLTDVWRGLLGVESFTADDEIQQWADSLMVARFPGVLKRKTGLTMTVQVHPGNLRRCRN